MLGLHFSDCNTFIISLDFKDCHLNLSSFFKLKLKRTKFINCSLQEVDFAEADLSASLFSDCDLLGAVFENTGLEKVDFRTSRNYSLDPDLNRIKKAKFSMPGIAGLLDKYDIDVE